MAELAVFSEQKAREVRTRAAQEWVRYLVLAEQGDAEAEFAVAQGEQAFVEQYLLDAEAEKVYGAGRYSR